MTYTDGCGLRSNTNRFKVHAAAAIYIAGMHTVLAIDLRTVQLGRYLLQALIVNNRGTEKVTKEISFLQYIGVK